MGKRSQVVLEEEKWVSGVSPDALLGASGRTFWVPGPIFLFPERFFKVRWIFYFDVCDCFINLYQPLSISMSFYISLFHALLLSMNPYESFSTYIHL